MTAYEDLVITLRQMVANRKALHDNSQYVSLMDAAADAVELLYAQVKGIVHCEECIYHRDDVCDRWADGTLMCPDDYCSRGMTEDELEEYI